MPGQHALLSPSKAHQWLACPPSARLSAKLNERFGEAASPYAQEGTKAHALSELKLRLELGEVNKFTYEAERKLLGEIPAEMERYTDNYIDTVLERYYAARHDCPDAVLLVEQKLDMSKWIPRCFGTGDAVIISDKLLNVIDLKYGKGVPVNAENNPQARCYGLGAIEAFGSLYDFDTVRTTIVQPRLGSITEETLAKSELLSWGDSVKPTAELAWRGEGKFEAGEHCRFCAAKAICKTRAMGAFDVFQHGFEEPGVLPDEEILGILRVADIAIAWLKDVKEYALKQALMGVEWQGYKVVKGKRPSRAFRNEEEAAAILAKAGYTSEQYHVSRLMTVAETEKLLGKKAFKALLADQVVQGEGLPTLAPEDDKRVAYEAADLAFEDMTEEGSNV